MNESQVTQALRSALDEETAGLTARPDTAQRARRQGRRRRTTRALLAAIPAAVLVAGTAAAVHGAAVTGPGPGQAVTSRSAELTAAYVTGQAEAALGQSGHYIVKEVMPDGVNTLWVDPVTGNIRQVVQAGNNTSVEWIHQYAVGNWLHWKVTTVDMSQRTWSSGTTQASGSMQKEPPSSKIPLSMDISPAQIRQALSSGQFRVIGHGVVNGQAVIKLGTDNSHIDYWLSARTYQPVQMVFGGRLTIRITWLLKTPALVAQTNIPQIPAGFRHIR